VGWREDVDELMFSAGGQFIDYQALVIVDAVPGLEGSEVREQSRVRAPSPAD
jgi:hypothetical protein